MLSYSVRLNWEKAGFSSFGLRRTTVMDAALPCKEEWGFAYLHIDVVEVKDKQVTKQITTKNTHLVTNILQGAFLQLKR